MLERRYDPQKLEPEIQRYWADRGIIEKALSLRRGKRKFKFLEGPPSVNAPPHVGHAQGRIIKDVILRLKTMQGLWVRRQAGWDCQGLPVEIATEQELGIKSKKDIEKIGLDQFVAKCRALAERNIKLWERADLDLGVWMDWQRAYRTMDDDYIEFVWWTMQKAYEKGLLVRELNVIPTCPRCETALSQHEVEQGYADRTDPSLFVKFQTKGNLREFLIIWTTTPWTLPGNMAVAVNPDFAYAKVKVGREIWIIAKDLVEKLMKKFGIKDYTILETLPGEMLAGIRYLQPLLYEVPEHKKFKGDYVHSVILADFVTLEEGSGLVHIAPGHGPEDFETGKRYSLPVFCPVRSNGLFTAEAGKYAEKGVFETNDEIVKDLRLHGLLILADRITHSYPHCWRCDNPLIYIASSQWFVKTLPLKKALIEENVKIKWWPEYVGKARFGDWLENIKDWCVSRQKIWGTPLPIWECARCGQRLIIGTRAELRAHAKKPFKMPELHRPWIDHVILVCPNCSADMTRIPDVADTWFDSGAAPGASLGYLRTPALFKSWFPAEFITEAIDQTRGWYYSLLCCSVLTFGQAPYLSVLNQEHVLDAKGRKMSKRLGNVILTTDAVKRLGADPVRLYLLWKAPVWERKNFDEHEVQLLRGQFFTVLWNCYLFYTTYALSDLRKPKGHQIEDRWILSRINSLLRDLDGRLVRYDLHGAVRIICDFLLKELSRWYIKLIRDRTWPAYRGADKKAALATLHAVLHKLTLALAPFCPFIAERAYQDIFKEQESVHLCSWPLADRKLINKKLEGQMEIAKRIVEAAAAARADAKIKLRYPLRTLIVTGSRDVLAAARALSTVIGTMANVKQVKIKKIKAEMLVKLNWPIAGKRFGARAKQLAAALARADAVRLKEEIDKKGRAMLGPFMLTAEDLIFTEKAEGTGREFPGGKVFLDTAVTPELRSEWLVRELIRAVQNKRKQLGLTVTDRVLLYLPDAQTFKPWTKIISYETGSRVILGKLRGMKAAFEFERRKYAFGVEHEKAP